ncbi:MULTISPECIES: hypothetical protein [Enterobacterales]|uniref:hypothetical protein n=1 Tax=Enterobacterales TaxID=91347 RepID=UPI000847E18F|nr:MULTISPECIES: hypothetical protein [Enterobacterales]ODQ05281.1 hypothetical protein BGK50_04685 [Shigella sp. FC130]OEI92733.1 hypothetical protein BHE86_06175 [Shigella sp. FC1655]WOO48255.1 hypothetical protein R2S03_12185 [Hafnia alvei]WPF02719.1 hypothetical protein SB028_11020 [Proteus vulgaris]
MKQILIIAGGILSLTIILAILVAILIVSVVKENSDEFLNESCEVIENSSSTVRKTLSTVEAKRDTLMAVYQSKDNYGSCQQLTEKLDDVEKALSNGNLILPRAAKEQILTIKNDFDGSTSPMKNIACKQALQVINDLSQ